MRYDAGVDAVRIFRPKPSLGWLWAVGFAAFVLGALALAVHVSTADSSQEIPLWAWVTLLVIDVPLFFLFAAVAVFFPSMRYELHADELVLRYGPILAYRIPYEEISGIEKRDLRVQLWSSMRWPGLALWSVPYSRLGTIRMVSTRVNRGVVLIRAGERSYGVSPLDEDRFIDEVTSRSRR